MINPIDHTNTLLWLALAIMIIPLLSSVICFLIRSSYAWVAPIISTLLLLASAIVSVFLIIQLPQGQTLQFQVPWLTVGNTTITASVLLSNTTVVMAMVVALISFLVHFYSIGYMSDDPRLHVYFGLLGFFTFAMLGLLWSNNLLVTFCFWELVGYSSYRLIGFWNTKPAAAQAATKSFIINRVADVGFLVGILMFYHRGALEITSLHTLPHDSHFTIAVVCIFIGVMGKSAQFPFFTWLPDAMEGPTPVSALIHAATMVAAGIFILVQMSASITPEAGIIMTVVGIITALIGGVGALTQFDLKKLLAYSTMSQLGLMIIAIGMGSAGGGYLHLLNHAFFKAGLFLVAGALIHSHHHATQDIRKLSIRSLRVVMFALVICVSSLAALPLTSGFVSKEVILNSILTRASLGSFELTVAVATLLISLLTVIYSFRLWWYLQSNDSTTSHDSPVIMRLPLMVLAIASVAILFSGQPFELAGWMNVIYPFATHSSVNILLISIGTSAAGIAIAYGFYRHRPAKDYSPVWASEFLFVDRLYRNVFIGPTLAASQLTLKIDRQVIDGFIHQLAFVLTAFAHVAHWLDRMIIDKILVEGLARLAQLLGWMARSLVSGKVQYYLLWALALFLIFMIVILYY